MSDFIDTVSHELPANPTKQKTVVWLHFTVPCKIQDTVCERVIVERRHRMRRYAQSPDDQFEERVTAYAYVENEEAEMTVRKHIELCMWQDVSLFRAIVWLANRATPVEHNS